MFVFLIQYSKLVAILLAQLCDDNHSADSDVFTKTERCFNKVEFHYMLYVGTLFNVCFSFKRYFNYKVKTSKV